MGQVVLPIDFNGHTFEIDATGQKSLLRNLHAAESIPEGRTDEIAGRLSWHYGDWTAAISHHGIIHDYDWGIPTIKPLQNYTNASFQLPVSDLFSIGFQIMHFEDGSFTTMLRINNQDNPREETLYFRKKRPFYLDTPQELPPQRERKEYLLTNTVPKDFEFEEGEYLVGELPKEHPLWIPKDRQKYLMDKVQEIYSSTNVGEERSNKLKQIGKELNLTEQLFLIGHATSPKYIKYKSRHGNIGYNLSTLLERQTGVCRDHAAGIKEFLLAVGYPKERLKIIETGQTRFHEYILVQLPSGEWVSPDTGYNKRFKTDNFWEAALLNTPTADSLTWERDGILDEGLITPQYRLVLDFLRRTQGE
jgi:hypothetical protein